MKRTKIVATIGPVTDSTEIMEALIKQGANVFRFNMKHATCDWHNERILRARQVALRLNIALGILIDLQGPEIRLETSQGQDLSFVSGEDIIFSINDASVKTVKIPTPEVFAAVKPGMKVNIDDGSIELSITQVDSNSFHAKSTQDCVIKHRKSMNFPGADIELPSLTQDDYERLDMQAMKEVDFVALSFTRSKKDVDILRQELQKRGSTAAICAKIENQSALDHLEEIVVASDAIMVARGDLAVETPFERLTYEQKRIIKLCRSYAKPVITATQMLHSMVSNKRPTRAEISDVSNAVYDGTDAVMLSEETAGGQFPIETVAVMAKIVEYVETVAQVAPAIFVQESMQQSIQMIHMKIEESEKPANILLFTSSSVGMVLPFSSLRTSTTSIVECASARQVGILNLSYGVVPVTTQGEQTIALLKQTGILTSSDAVATI